MNKTLTIFLNCFIWAGIGTAIALHLGWLWWVGLLAGSGLGYLTCDWRAVAQAIPSAWDKATSWRPDWKAFRRFCRDFGKTFFYMASWSSNLLLPCVLVVPGELIIHTVLPAFLGSLVFLAFLIVIKGTALSSMEDQRQMARDMNPIKVIFYWLPLGLFRYLPKGIAIAALALARFIRYLFLAIHSKERLLVVTDIAIGICVGTYYGHVLIGSLVGGLAGLLNWVVVTKLILQQWLGLLPPETVRRETHGRL